MGSKVSMPAPTPAPAPVDPAKSSLDFVQAMSDPALQGRIFEAESLYRPQYTQLELADINTLLQGGGGQAGLLELSDIATRQASEQARLATSAQRAADIADVEALGGRASAAFLAANPELAKSIQQAESLRSGGMDVGDQIKALVAQGMNPQQAAQIAQSNLGAGLQQAGMQQLAPATGEAQLNQMGLDFLGRGGALTALQQRNVEQQARAGSAARGRIGDQSSLYGEIGARLAEEMNLEKQNAAMGAQLLAQGFGMGQQRLGTAGNIYGQDLAREQANLQAEMSQRGLDATQRSVGLQSLLGLGQLQQSQLQADRAYAMNLIGARQGTASDPFQAILGRPVQAPGMGAQSTQFAAGLAGQPVGPNLFDPNAGINLALQNQANQANYQSNIYGAQASYAGATNQGRGAMIGGIISGLGALGGGAAIAM